MLLKDRNVNLSIEEAELKAELNEAIEKNELELFYQHRVDSRTGKIVGLEALLEWNHPKLGNIGPDSLLSEDTDMKLMKRIDEWVIKRVCANSREWMDQGLNLIPVAVKLLFCCYENDELIKLIKRVLKDTKLQAKYLEIDISENVKSCKASSVSEFLRKIKLMGISVAIYDNGSAFSIMNEIRQLPVDRVIISRNILGKVLTNQKDRIFAQAVISLIRQLEIEMVAEGVESTEEVEFLSSEGCYILQGYDHKPLSQKKADMFLETNRRIRLAENTTQNDLSDKNISKYLEKYGIHHSNTGYRYLMNAVRLGYQEPQLLYKISNLYEDIAQSYGIRTANLERAIRYSLKGLNMTSKEFIAKAVHDLQYY